MKNKVLLIMAMILIGITSLKAQLNVGSAIAPNSSAVLQATSTTQGFLPPVMTTVQRNAIGLPATGLVVFNLTTGCLEIYNGTAWKSTCSSNLTASFTASTLACTGAQAGTYVATVTMASTNTQIVTITTNSPGDYSVSTNLVNGVSFAASGTISSIGAGTQLTMTATGTPIAAGAFTYTTTLAGQTCTFSVTYANPPAILANNSVDCQSSSAASGTYSTGKIVVAANNTKTIQVTPAGIGYYSYTTGAVNGITFSASGTFVAADVTSPGTPKTITLIATGTPVASTGSPYSFTVTGTGISTSCSFTVPVVQSNGYMVAAVSGTTSLSPSQKIPLSTISSNGLAVTSATDIILLPGKTYLLTASIRLTGSSWMSYNFTNSSGTLLSGTTAGIAYPDANNSDIQSPVFASGIHTVGATSETISLSVGANCPAGTIGSDASGQSSIMIKEIPAAAGFAVGMVNDFSQKLVANNPISWIQAASSGASISGTNITLLAGKTYYLSSGLRIINVGSGELDFNFRNAGGTTLSGTSIGKVFAINENYSQSNVEAKGIHTVGASNELITVNIFNAPGDVVGNGDGNSYVLAEEIPAPNTYAIATAGSGQTPAANAPIIWNAVKASNGVTISGSDITLLPGKTYMLSATIRAFSGPVTHMFADVSGNKLTGTTASLITVDNGTTSQSICNNTSMYTVGATAQIIRVIVASASSVGTDGNGETSVVITELK